ALRLEQYLRPRALQAAVASCRGPHAPSPAPAGVIASARSRTFPLLVLYRTSFHCAKPARNETNTAAHIRRVLRSTFQRTPAAAARSLSLHAKNNVASTRARSRHRLEMPAASHKQRASRNLQSSAPPLPTPTLVSAPPHQPPPP